MNTSNTEIVTVNGQNAIVKIATAGGGVAASFLTLNEWVQVLTILFLLLQIILLVPKYAQMLRAWHRGHKIEVKVK